MDKVQELGHWCTQQGGKTMPPLTTHTHTHTHTHTKKKLPKLRERGKIWKKIRNKRKQSERFFYSAPPDRWDRLQEKEEIAKNQEKEEKSEEKATMGKVLLLCLSWQTGLAGYPVESGVLPLGNDKIDVGNHDISVNGIWREIFSFKILLLRKKTFSTPLYIVFFFNFIENWSQNIIHCPIYKLFQNFGTKLATWKKNAQATQICLSCNLCIPVFKLCSTQYYGIKCHRAKDLHSKSNIFSAILCSQS